MIARLDYQPLFGKWACAPPPDMEDRESGGIQALKIASS